MQVTGEVTSPPIWQAKSGGDETPATKKECKKEAFVSKRRRPRRLTASTYRNLFRFTYPPRKRDEETAQGEERKKSKRESPTSSEDDKLSAGREATRHEGNLLSKEVPLTPA